MSDWSPPSVPRKWAVSIGILYLLLIIYAVIVAQQLLLFGIVPGMILVSVYVLWRFFVAVEAIADALQRIAHQQEQD